MTTAHEQIELRTLVEDLLGVELSAADRALLALRLGWDGRPATQHEVARSLGISQGAVSKREVALRDRMKRELAESGQVLSTRYFLPTQGTVDALSDRRRVLHQPVSERVG